jgi:hypothetical protein
MAKRDVAKLAIRAGTRAFVSHHAPIIHHDLIGCPVPLDGRVPIMMRPVPRPDGPTGLAAVETPEEYALNPWRQGDFLASLAINFKPPAGRYSL